MSGARNKANGSRNPWWVFWSNYSFVLFVIAALYLLTLPAWLAIFTIAAISFVLARLVLTPLIAALYPKPRPYQLSGQAPATSWFFSWATTKANAFPSRHVISLATFSVVVLQVLPWLGMLLLGITVLTGWGRVKVGFHDWWDVLGGLLLGALVAELVILLSKTLGSSIL